MGGVLGLDSFICTVDTAVAASSGCRLNPAHGRSSVRMQPLCLPRPTRTKVRCHTLRPWSPLCWGQVMKPDPGPEGWAMCLSTTLPDAGCGSDIWLPSPGTWFLRQGRGSRAGPCQPACSRLGLLGLAPTRGRGTKDRRCLSRTPPLRGRRPSSCGDPQPPCPQPAQWPQHLLPQLLGFI